MYYKPWSIQVDEMQFVGKRWGDEGGTPVIALHGWLDNCASFDRLAPLLSGVDLYCIDMAGHGRTSRRSSGGPYNLWQDVEDIFNLADKLGFDQFGLLGHSRGGMVATAAAGTFPERVSALGLIEGVVPPVIKLEDAPKQLAQSLREKKIYKDRGRTVYPSYDKAVYARENGLFELSHEDASTLAEWGVEQVGEGFSWCYDPGLMISSSFRLTIEQVMAFVKNISAPTRVVLSTVGVYTETPEVIDILRSLDIELEILEGTHHLHMSQQHERIASYFEDLFV